ncbi:hypothetical protein PUMCH_004462 [Australozyma saopauloensis]|uniref:Major facilitator superfamily (MFS) profile domain-containing protein n=1 Tax=Australozyma saopauloensis TaxID=291208 RepID=A0AAX4HEW1_9ASCO|nr:hypothetical protein PUMCH_004462 [[Candida] saopauloensis]
MSSEEKDPLYEVSFDTLEDPEDPLALSDLRKWLIVGLISCGSICITSISSIWSLVSPSIMEEYHISQEVSTLGISFYIWGMGTGGMFLSPISEFHGRKIVYVSGLFLVFAFGLVPAFSHNIGSILFSRAIAGFFSSSFMSVAGGTFSDLFKKTERTANFKRDQQKELNKALLMYSVSPFFGAGLGPIIAGAVVQYLPYRWAFYIMSIWSGVMTLLVIVFVPETYEPVLLKKKAARLRKSTGDDRYFAPIEKIKQSLVRSIFLSSKRPILLILKDYMTMALCFYSGFVLAVIYLFFVSFPYTFRTVYHFNSLGQGLAFIGLILGLCLTAIISPPFIKIWYDHLMAKNNGVHVTEFRLLPLIIGAFLTPIGLFILAWTSYPHVHWIAPIIGSFVFGAGTSLVFSGIFAYTVEAYRKYTASAMATNSFVRSMMSGAFPLFGLQMYKALGIQWATTILAVFSCFLIPIPFIFYKYGAMLRAKSPYTWSD